MTFYVHDLSLLSTISFLNSYKIIEENFNANLLPHQAKIVLQIAHRHNVTSLWPQPTIDVELVWNTFRWPLNAWIHWASVQRTSAQIRHAESTKFVNFCNCQGHIAWCIQHYNQALIWQNMRLVWSVKCELQDFIALKRGRWGFLKEVEGNVE